MTYQSARPININYGRVGRAPAEKHGDSTVSASRRASSSRSQLHVNSPRSASRQNRVPSARPTGASGYSRNSRGGYVSAEKMRRDAQNSARRRAEAERRLAERERELAAIKAYEKKVKRENAEAHRAARLAEKKKLKRDEAEMLKSEIKVERVKLPISFIVSVAVAFIMLMGVVFSFSEVSKSSTELSDMKYELSGIEAEAEKLGVVLERKNDLRVIEDTAENDYMMVREDAVQKKYISLSSGDRIVLENKNENTEDKGFFGEMLSSFASAFDGILDYFH